MSPKRLGIARVFDLLERAHGVGGRGNERPSWMEQRLFSLLEGIARGRSMDAMQIAEGLESEPQLLAEIADTLRVGETRFYRDPAQWQALRGVILPQLKVERVRALSVGCSTGEEAFTLGMMIDQEAQLFEDGFRVVGMDRSDAALTVARSATYPSSAAVDLPAPLQARYLAASGPDALSIAPRLRAQVSFVTRDVMNGLPAGQYEIIVCKNMLIYFGEQARAKVVESLLYALTPGGALVVARSEVPLVRNVRRAARVVAPGVIVFERAPEDLR